jgi:membrane protease YdiL (CAAX protease family)
MYVVLVGVVFLTMQTVAAILVAVMSKISDPSLNVREWSSTAASNGSVLSAATFASAAVCVPLIWFLVRTREPDPSGFLRLRPTSRRSIVSWSIALVVFAGATDLISLAAGREVVVDFMIDAYSSAPPLLLFLALVIAAPLFEEILFRGFLMSALESRGVSAAVAAVVSSALWASIHVQYDLYIIAVIFLGGLLLAAARIRTGSLVPCVVMHGLLNAIAFAETAYFAEAAGTH